MKIHAYRVEVQNGPPMHDLLSQIAAAPFEGRLRDTTGGRIRLDEVAPADNIWLLDFVKHRDGHGPGIASASDRVSGLALRAGQTFAEETAALFDGATGYMLVQYNHYGPRFGAIEDYLAGFVPRPNNGIADLRLGAVLREDAYVRLRQKPIVRSIEFAISVPGVRQADRNAGRSLGSVLNAPLPRGLGTLTMRMDSVAEEPLERGHVLEIVDTCVNSVAKYVGCLLEQRITSARRLSK